MRSICFPWQIADISRKSADIQTSIADREFTRWAQKVSGDLGVQFDIFRRKALELTDEATKLQGSAKDSIQEKLADQAWKRAEAFVRQSEQIASQTKDVEQLRKVQQLVDDLDEKRIIALTQQSKTQAEVAKEAERRANQAEAKRLADLKTQLDAERAQLDIDKENYKEDVIRNIAKGVVATIKK